MNKNTAKIILVHFHELKFTKRHFQECLYSRKFKNKINIHVSKFNLKKAHFSLVVKKLKKNSLKTDFKMIKKNFFS